MPAGHSTGTDPRRQPSHTGQHAHRAAAAAPGGGARLVTIEVGDELVARALAPLVALGHRVLTDPRPGAPGRATADVVVVGPGGVFVVVGKAWTDVEVRGDQVRSAATDVTDEVLEVADLAYTAEGAFAEVGLAPGEVRPLVVIVGQGPVDARFGPVRIVDEVDVVRHITSYGTRLTPAQVEVVAAHARRRLTAEPDPPLAADPPPAWPQARTEHPGGLEVWMTFLHPAQARLVRRSFDGPSRIRGAAGTGKTVVGLHRATYLARTRPGTVLVTAFVRALPEVMRDQIARMAPDVADRVEVTRVQDWARALLAERGVPVRVEARAAAESFEAAWRALPAAGWLARSGQDRGYWKDEIGHVIKGRGLTSFQQYATLPRTGRGLRIDVDRRRQVWDLYAAYQEALAARGVHDFDDVFLLAEAELRREPLTGRYSAVVVDEAQDLSAVMVRMLHRLVGDAPDGLTLVGDGQQCLYPGGCTLAEAGVSIAGRGVVLDVDYRNTAQILTFAQRLIAGDEFADIEGQVTTADLPRRVARSGPEPVVERYRSLAARDRGMLDRLRTVLHDLAVAPGEVGVLCGTRRAAESVAALLHSIEVPAVLFEEHEGGPVDAVRVGTVRRAKGLEFAQVLLPDVHPEQLAEAPTDPVERERWAMARRELYVAMTRARDGLWVSVL